MGGLRLGFFCVIFPDSLPGEGEKNKCNIEINKKKCWHKEKYSV